MIKAVHIMVSKTLLKNPDIENIAAASARKHMTSLGVPEDVPLQKYAEKVKNKEKWSYICEYEDINAED